MAHEKIKFRIEHDSLGECLVPESVYYGIQTQRAVENFPISALHADPAFIKATALVKIAAVTANMTLGLIPKRKGRAILRAGEEILDGKLHEQFVVDIYQAGAGTSHNMNANEVIANRAIEILGGKRGDYSIVHPNDDVNMAQSTNDTFPSAMRVAMLMESRELVKTLTSLKTALRRKARSFESIIKSARTHLQDAVPITLGQEFNSYASALVASIQRINEALAGLKSIGLGATAAGTGINTHPEYARYAVRELAKVSGLKGLKCAIDPVSALSSFGDFVAFSASLRACAIELIKIANDLRLLCSGPRTGLAEIKLPPVQPGSSIMPGKVNPVMAEMLNMVAFQVLGNDQTVVMAAQAGQFELNVMGPVINCNILSSVKILSNATRVFSEKCIKGLKANKTRCRTNFENSVGLATILNRYIGYEQAGKIAVESELSGKTIRQLLLDSGKFTTDEINILFDPVRLTRPG